MSAPNVVACPSCEAKLRVPGPRGTVRCPRCAYLFLVDEGIETGRRNAGDPSPSGDRQGRFTDGPLRRRRPVLAWSLFSALMAVVLGGGAMLASRFLKAPKATTATVTPPSNASRPELRELAGVVRPTGPVMPSDLAALAVAVSPDGKVVATGNAQGEIRLTDARSGEPRGKLLGHSKPIRRLVFSPVGGSLFSADEANDLVEWSLPDGRQVKKANVEGLTDLAVSTNGVDFAVSTATGIRRFRFGTFEEASTLDPSGHYECVAFSKDGELLAAGDWQGNVQAWTARDGFRKSGYPWTPPIDQTAADREEHRQAVTSVAFSPDVRWLAAGRNDGTIRVWNVFDSSAIADFTTMSNPLVKTRAWVSVVAFSPDGTQFLSADREGYLRFWSVSLRSGFGSVKAHTAGIDAVAFDPVGKRFVTVAGGTEIQWWSQEDGMSSKPEVLNR